MYGASSRNYNANIIPSSCPSSFYSRIIIITIISCLQWTSIKQEWLIKKWLQHQLNAQTPANNNSNFFSKGHPKKESPSSKKSRIQSGRR